LPNPDLYYNKAVLCLYVQDYDEAVSLYRHAHALDPSLNPQIPAIVDYILVRLAENAVSHYSFSLLLFLFFCILPRTMSSFFRRYAKRRHVPSQQQRSFFRNRKNDRSSLIRWNVRSLNSNHHQHYLVHPNWWLVLDSENCKVDPTQKLHWYLNYF